MNSAKPIRQTQSKAVASGGKRPSRLHESDLSRRLWKTSALSTVAALASSGAVQGQEAALWQPQVRAIVGGDEQGAFTALEGFIPLTQTADSVVFLDLRLEYDNSVGSDGPGGDVGIGLRRIINPDLIVGGYAYLNVERFDGNQFTGATLGVEAIATNFDAHVNVNLPFGSQSQDESSATSSLSFIGNQLLEQVSLLNVRDYASWGVEGEIGVQAPLDTPPGPFAALECRRLSLRGCRRYCRQHHRCQGRPRIQVRATYSAKERQSPSAAKCATTMFTIRTLVGYARLTIPLGERAAPRNGERETIYNVSEGLRKRANDRVRGDIGVRVDTDETTASFTRRARNVAGQEFGLFFFADGENTLGLGTLGDPTTLDDAVARAASGFVVALGGSGNLLTGGVTLPNGQTVIGGGQSVQALLLDGSTRSFALGGSDGTIQGTNPANAVLNLGNGNTLQGITVTGGGVGILGNNVNGATLTNVTVSGTGGDGASFTGTSTGINASNFSATGNGGSGLSIVGDGTYNFTGTTLLSGNAVDGLSITGNGTYNFQTINALNNGDDGIEVTSTSGTFTTTGGTISGNGDIGVKIDPINANVVLSSITHNGGTSGVVLDDVAGSFTVTGATNISNTSGPAIAISNSPASIRFGDVTMTNPGGAGMTFAGTNGPVVVGGIVISGLGAGDTGLDFSGSRTTFTAQSVDITGHQCCWQHRHRSFRDAGRGSDHHHQWRHNRQCRHRCDARNCRVVGQHRQCELYLRRRHNRRHRPHRSTRAASIRSAVPMLSGRPSSPARSSSQPPTSFLSVRPPPAPATVPRSMISQQSTPRTPIRTPTPFSCWLTMVQRSTMLTVSHLAAARRSPPSETVRSMRWADCRSTSPASTCRTA